MVPQHRSSATYQAAEDATDLLLWGFVVCLITQYSAVTHFVA
jgi:hypothetical protein